MWTKNPLGGWTGFDSAQWFLKLIWYGQTTEHKLFYWKHGSKYVIICKGTGIPRTSSQNKHVAPNPFCTAILVRKGKIVVKQYNLQPWFKVLVPLKYFKVLVLLKYFKVLVGLRSQFKYSTSDFTGTTKPECIKKARLFKQHSDFEIPVKTYVSYFELLLPKVVSNSWGKHKGNLYNVGNFTHDKR